MLARALMLSSLVLFACPGPMPGSTSSSSSSSGGGQITSSSSSSSGASGASHSSSSSSSGSGGGSSGTAGSGKVGDPCSSDSDCKELTDMHCYKAVTNPFDGSMLANFPGGFCSKGCPNGDECGMEYACNTVSQAGGMSSSSLSICYPTCSMASQCRTSEGYTCKMFFGLGGYCAPP